MPTQKKTVQALPAAPVRPRVRRNNKDDAEQLRRELMQATLALFIEGGPQAVTMRAVAARVGVSPMSTYRYFADKQELMVGLWQHIIAQLVAEMTQAVAKKRTGRARHMAFVEAFLTYWEQHPEHYALMYGFSRVDVADERAVVTAEPIYTGLLETANAITLQLAGEIGASTRHLRLASDVRLAMLLGYLHGTLVVRRIAWSDTAVLRRAYLAQVQQAVERCLLQGS